jgi:hypothetical protein
MRFIYTARQGPSIPENARLWEAGAQFFERDGPRPFIWKIAHASHRRIAIVASAAQSNYPARWWKPLPDGGSNALSVRGCANFKPASGVLLCAPKRRSPDGLPPPVLAALDPGGQIAHLGLGDDGIGQLPVVGKTHLRARSVKLG